MTMAQPGVTKPAPGVTHARPATIPEARPKALGRLSVHHSRNIQDEAAAAAATMLVVKARAALALAPRALPALKPNQPNHSNPAPRRVMVRL